MDSILGLRLLVCRTLVSGQSLVGKAEVCLGVLLVISMARVPAKLMEMHNLPWWFRRNIIQTKVLFYVCVLLTEAISCTNTDLSASMQILQAVHNACCATTHSQAIGALWMHT